MRVAKYKRITVSCFMNPLETLNKNRSDNLISSTELDDGADQVTERNNKASTLTLYLALEMDQRDSEK